MWEAYIRLFLILAMAPMRLVLGLKWAISLRVSGLWCFLAKGYAF